MAEPFTILVNTQTGERTRFPGHGSRSSPWKGFTEIYVDSHGQYCGQTGDEIEEHAAQAIVAGHTSRQPEE